MGLIDPAHRLASWFLLGSSVLSAAAYALPLLLSPMAWARFFRWPIPHETRLCVYLGRCVGGLALAIIVIVLRAAPDPAGNLPVFDLIALCGASMVIVHVWGALQRVQPWTEDAEIALYALLTGAALWIRTTLA